MFISIHYVHVYKAYVFKAQNQCFYQTIFWIFQICNLNSFTLNSFLTFSSLSLDIPSSLIGTSDIFSLLSFKSNVCCLPWDLKSILMSPFSFSSTETSSIWSSSSLTERFWRSSSFAWIDLFNLSLIDGTRSSNSASKDVCCP